MDGEGSNIFFLDLAQFLFVLFYLYVSLTCLFNYFVGVTIHGKQQCPASL